MSAARLAAILLAGLGIARGETVQGLIVAAPDAQGIFTIAPVGRKDAVKVAASTGGAGLRAGMWIRAEVSGGRAASIQAGPVAAGDAERCVLFEGMPESFFKDPAGFDFESLPTAFGRSRVVYKPVRGGAYIRWGQDRPRKEFVIHWPASIKASRFSFGSGFPVPDALGRVLVPGNAGELRVRFESDDFSLSGDTADPRGPVINRGMNAVVTPEGVETRGFRYVPAPGGAPQHASWIWHGGKSDAPAACFRKTVTIPEKPSSVKARVTADTVYRLWVNGQIVSRGPADHGNDYSPRSRWTHQWLYDVRDLTPFFRKGENVIAAEVFTKGHPNFTLGKPGFLFEADFELAGGKKLTVASGPDWSAIPAEAYTLAQWKAGDAKPVAYLRFDAALEPRGWRLAGFDASKWAAAAKVEGIWENLTASEIPPRTEVVYPKREVVRTSEGVTAGKTIKLDRDGRFAVRYDRVLSAYIGVRVKGPAGAVVTIQPSELNKPGFHRLTAAVLREGITYYEFPVMDSFSVLNFEVTGAKAPVEFEDIRASFVSYPAPYQGSFKSSDAELNRIWKASRWATQICMQTHHLDSPHHQEPISDPGDYLIEALENYYAFGEPWLARQDLRKFGLLLKNSGYLNFHTSYSLLWLQMLLDYYDYTGDAGLVKELAPMAYGLLDRFTSWRGKNGLISEAPNYMFMDWVSIAGIACHHPPAVIGQGYMTAFYYRGLADARRIAEVMGDRERVTRYDKLRTETSAAFHRELWNPQKGLYRDGKPNQTSVQPGQWLPADTAIETFSPHVNTLAVLYDLAPKSEQPGIIDRVMSESPINAQPYFMHFVFDAIAHAGLFEKYAMDQMHRWQIHPDTGTASEMWTRGDYSHGWVGTPLIQMSARILGVTPASPGFKTVSIRPMTAGLEWVRGVVPTPQGNIEVSWKKTGAELKLKVTIPPGSTGEVHMPGASRAATLPAGTHELTGAAGK